VITRAVGKDETLEDVREEVVEVIKVVVEVVVEIEIELEMVGVCAALLLVNSLLHFLKGYNEANETRKKELGNTKATDGELLAVLELELTLERAAPLVAFRYQFTFGSPKHSPTLTALKPLACSVCNINSVRLIAVWKWVSWVKVR